MIKVEGLKKAYGQVAAVDGLNFGVKKGECYCLLGPNGAGKTTTLKMLTGQLAPDGGLVTISGLDPLADEKKVLELINIIPQHHAMDPFLTVEENLVFYGLLQKIKLKSIKARLNHCLDAFELRKIKDKKVTELSGGEYRRAQISRAFIKEAPLLFMDEPTANLDIIFKNKFWDLIKEEKKKGVTVLLNTHDFNEAEVLSDRVGFVFKGKIVCDDTVGRLKGLTAKSIIAIKFVSPEAASESAGELRGIFGEENVSEASAGTMELKVREFDGKFFSLLQRIPARDIVSFEVKHPTLNDVFRVLGKIHAGNTVARS
ncbi:MAG: ABC transporter ATP-binding protein [Elusimicrobiales bacterium]|nr:ABC transporter ATP-binding protein [Elusimicrobiales bacterium]